jgi:cytoskeletal protein CcmA (bactofilin family)
MGASPTLSPPSPPGRIEAPSPPATHGEVEGDIDGNRVIIGESARITGTVRAEDVVIFGQVVGSVGERCVSLQSTSRIEGDVYHQVLVLEQGAFFEGKSVRSDDPLAPKSER